MNKLFLALGLLMAGALLLPDVAEAQRGGRGGGGGARVGGGGFGGGGVRGGGGFGGGPRMSIPRGGMGGARVGMGAGGVRSGAITARPGAPGRVGVRPGAGGVRQAAINNPGNRGDWRYGYGATGGRYPYYGGMGAGLVAGSVIGAAAAYPYYNYPYSNYQTPISSAAGGYCATSVGSCALTSPAPVGTGCSCRTSGGRARGTVVTGY